MATAAKQPLTSAEIVLPPVPAADAAPKLAVIGGSSFLESKYFASFEAFVVDTPYGGIKLRRAAAGSGSALQNVLFVQRHAADPVRPYTPPHLLNPRAVIYALKQLNVQRIVAFASVGSLTAALPVGTLLVPDDFFSPYIIPSFFDDARAHRVLTLHEGLRTSVIKVLKAAGVGPLAETGVYGQTLGPRFETVAEIKALARDAHVVGMTGAHEMTLAAELDLPYVCVSMVDNFANGIGKPLLAEEWRAGVHNNLKKMETVLGIVLKAFAPDAAAVSAALDASAATAAAATTAATAAGADAKAPAAAAAAKVPTVVDLLVHARHIVTLEGAATDADNGAGALEHHTLVVSGGKIVDVLPTAAATAQYTALETVDLAGTHVLLPGLVNAHTHAGMTLLRGYSDDKCLHDWLTRDIWPTEAKFVSAEFVRDSARLAVAEMIRGGTTCFNDMYFHPSALAQVVHDTGVRAVIGCPLLDFPSAFAGGFGEYVKAAEQAMDAFKDHPRMAFTFAPHAPYTVCDANLAQVKTLAAKRGVRIHTHLHETAAEVNDSKAGNTASSACHRSEQRTSPVVNFDRLGLLGPATIAVHMTQLSGDEVKLVGARHAHVAHCPTSNLKLASGICPVQALTDAGANVALGTDSSASNNSLDMFFETKLAAVLAKGSSGNPEAVPAAQALRLATVNGANALGWGQHIGSLKVGKFADFIAVSLDSLELLPLYDVVSHLVYAASRDKVSHVWVAGKCLLRNRQLTTIDEPALVAAVKHWNAKLGAFHKQLQAEQKLKSPTAAAAAAKK